MELVVEHLACRRGNRILFSKLSFRVTPGHIVILRGANGVGKTSLLRILAGLSRPTAGQVLWQGLSIYNDLEAYVPNIHYLGHLDGLKGVLTVRENIAYHSSLRGLIPSETALDTFTMTPLADLPTRFLSAGQRRRLALTRLCATPASLWLLDEPYTALDHEAANRLDVLLAQHCAADGMAVIASHDSTRHKDAPTIDLDSLVHRAA